MYTSFKILTQSLFSWNSSRSWRKETIKQDDSASLAIEVTYSHMFKYYINFFINISENDTGISYAVVLGPPYLNQIKCFFSVEFQLLNGCSFFSLYQKFSYNLTENFFNNLTTCFGLFLFLFALFMFSSCSSCPQLIKFQSSICPSICPSIHSVNLIGSDAVWTMDPKILMCLLM